MAEAAVAGAAAPPRPTSPPAATAQDEKDDSVREIGHLAVWTVTSAKAGNGVELMRDSNKDTYWQSDGAQPHTVDIHFHKKVHIKVRAHRMMHLSGIRSAEYANGTTAHVGAVELAAVRRIRHQPGRRQEPAMHRVRLHSPTWDSVPRRSSRFTSTTGSTSPTRPRPSPCGPATTSWI